MSDVFLLLFNDSLHELVLSLLMLNLRNLKISTRMLYWAKQEPIYRNILR